MELEGDGAGMSLDLQGVLASDEPVFIVDGQGLMLHRNGAATAFLQTGIALIDDAGRLAALNAADQARLSARISQVARLYNLGLAQTAPLRVQGVRPYLLTFEPLGRAAQRVVVIRGQDAFSDTERLCAAFARSHGLGLAEERLLLALSLDRTLQDYCDAETLNLWTERSRLQDIYRRSGVNRQSSLIIAVLTGARGAAKPALADRGSSQGRRPQPPPVTRSGASSRRPLVYKGHPRPPTPSFASLAALEAFVRLGSMTAAGGALRTYPGNISRHIRKLEASTGLALTLGARPLVEPTPAGCALAAAAKEAFEVVEQAAPGLLERGADRTVETDAGDDNQKERARLPLFTRLKALEAFVRLGTFTAAAVELRTLPSNIGLHIRALEEDANLALLEGLRRAARPTPEGLRLATAVAHALDVVHIAAPVVHLKERPLSRFLEART